MTRDSQITVVNTSTYFIYFIADNDRPYICENLTSNLSLYISAWSCNMVNIFVAFHITIQMICGGTRIIVCSIVTLSPECDVAIFPVP